MKIYLSNSFLILFLLLTFSSICFAKEITQADIIQMANKQWQENDVHFDKVCNNIRKSFKEHKEFLEYFEKDLSIFKEHRREQVDMALPKRPVHLYYGMSNYYVYGPWYNIEINNQKLDFYKNAVENYCKYNNTLDKWKECEKANIEAIFK